MNPQSALHPPFPPSLPSLPPTAAQQTNNHTWALYNHGPKHPIFIARKNDGGPSLYSPLFSIYASTMESVAHSYLEEEGVWIIPKQNKIRLGCTLEGHLSDLIRGMQTTNAQHANASTQIRNHAITTKTRTQCANTTHKQSRNKHQHDTLRDKHPHKQPLYLAV